MSEAPYNRPGTLREHMNDPELQGRIRGADVVVGVDPATGESWDFFISRPADGRAANVLRLTLDGATDDPECAAAMVRRLRGRLDVPLVHHEG